MTAVISASEHSHRLHSDTSVKFSKFLQLIFLYVNHTCFSSVCVWFCLYLSSAGACAKLLTCICILLFGYIYKRERCVSVNVKNIIFMVKVKFSLS